MWRRLPTPSAAQISHTTPCSLQPKHDFSLIANYSEPIKDQQSAAAVDDEKCCFIRTNAWKSATGSTRKHPRAAPATAYHRRTAENKTKLIFCSPPCTQRSCCEPHLPPWLCRWCLVPTEGERATRCFTAIVSGKCAPGTRGPRPCLVPTRTHCFDGAPISSQPICSRTCTAWRRAREAIHLDIAQEVMMLW